MGALAVFGIENDGLNLAVNLLLLFLVVIWLALIYWTYADARRRIADPMLVGCATAASLFPFLGTIVYMIVRPPEYLEDVRERELEIAAAEARLASLEHLHCPYCGFEVEKAFLRCPSCLRRLRSRARSAASRSTRAGRSAPTARPRSARRRPRRARAAPGGAPRRPGTAAPGAQRAAQAAAPGRAGRARRAAGHRRAPARRASLARAPALALAPALDRPAPEGDGWTGP